MKKLTTLFGVLFCASIFLTSCSSEDKSNEENKVVDTPVSDAKKAAECTCDMMELMNKAMENPEDAADLEKDANKLEKKCESLMDELEKKYEDEESDEAKEFAEAFKKELEDCGY